MTITKTSAVVGVAGLLAGFLLSIAVFTAFDPGSPPLPDRPSLDDHIENAPVPRPSRTETTGVTAESIGEPVTDEELTILRNALVAERQRRAEAAAAEIVRIREASVHADDDGLTIMRRYLKYGADVSDLVSDYTAMRSHIRTEPGPVHRVESTGPRTSVELGKLPAEATVIEFGDGVFVLSRGNMMWNDRRNVVNSLEIRGAGMDRTTLIGPGWAFICASGEGRIQNLVIRDVTINAIEKGQIVVDARSGISVALERVRIAGWEVAGHAAALGVSGNGYLACRDCIFEGTGRGWVLSLRGPALATFEKCRFVNAFAALIAGSGSERPSVVHLNDCVFDGVRLSDRKLRRGETGGAHVVIRGGSAAIGSSSWDDEKRRSHFLAEEAVSIESFTFTTASPLFSVDQAARALDLAASAGLPNLLALDAHPSVRGKPVEIDFYTLADKAGDRPVRHVRVFDGLALAKPRQDPRRGQRGFSVLSAEDLARAMPMGDLLRGAGIAADETVLGVRLQPGPKVGEGEDVRRQVMFIVQLAGNRTVVLNAETGEKISSR